MNEVCERDNLGFKYEVTVSRDFHWAQQITEEQINEFLDRDVDAFITQNAGGTLGSNSIKRKSFTVL